MSIQTSISTQPGLPYIPPAQIATPISESFGTCLERIFTAFCNAIKKLIADIQVFFQDLMGNETSNPLKTKALQVEAELPVVRPITILKERVTTLIDKMQAWNNAPVALTADQREHRIRTGAADIQSRIEKEGQHAQNQMAREIDKAFVYQVAPYEFPAVEHEERIGNYEMGLCHYIGSYRDDMEDEHVARTFNLSIAGTNYKVPLFAIMDGHGGKLCADFVRDNLQQILQETLQEFNPLTDEGIWNALKHTGVRLHERFCAKYYDGKNAKEQNTSGTTLVFSMILDGKLWTANVGDSRAILDDNGVPLQLSEDAKPADPSNPDPEITRYNNGIIHRGGEVLWNDTWRINGRLACGRTIGDPQLKGANSARAKITMRSLDSVSPNSYLILGCDGIFDVSSMKQIVEAVHQNGSLNLGTLAKNIVYSTEMSRSTDNQSIMIVRLK